MVGVDIKKGQITFFALYRKNDFEKFEQFV
jgi:hypothetical protein